MHLRCCNLQAQGNPRACATCKHGPFREWFAGGLEAGVPVRPPGQMPLSAACDQRKWEPPPPPHKT
eukprot:15464334-Alexandrium_andersonii.AAC.1